ncbi:8-oxo-dGTP pyrophosphatase MutT (NUDIX family) [Litorivivens lipolytica]|uniref:Phosphatase NudJ n=1 Tax=Litorivivens lipolytica TaxID=1524264 RepID=A0A7W4W3D4_9GAMM|nr:NUDIX hydrolase [Litorivivens lipolytica]MBB3046408.1 8-oxo-dGTP pyrophosphatase MutT (NUDIX family) [Litorivivens lipolytica]
MTDERPWHAHVTVATVIERDGKFLVVEEIADGERVINQPAGHLEPEESLVEAARREVLEETGYDCSIDGIIGTTLYKAANGVTYYRTSFFGTALGKINSELDDGIIQPLWLSRKELQARESDLRSHLVLATIDQYLKGHRYPLELIYG